MANLTRQEALDRAALLDVTSYEVDLDLTGGDDPGHNTFGSVATIRFGCRRPGAATFLDVVADTLHEVVLNGRPLDPASVRSSRVELPGLAAENVLTVRATMRYSHDGQGLHRAEDPADGRHYVYGHLFLDAAPRVFACFDQPDLKAPFTVTVSAPHGWLVLGNGAPSQVGEGRWALARTRPLATYVVTVCAGPYASAHDEHDGIPLGIHARASLGRSLREQAPQMLEVTRAAFDYYHALFNIRYPFGEYHQVFVPEFNAGAMENPGCVTFRDAFVFRGAATDDEVLGRSNTIAHELAHMWFGDLVTMRWWDDLWLNESFAEYMAHRTLVAATPFATAWVDSTMSRKTWGYAAERTPSTHPVAGAPALDADRALQNFDGISYAKGAAVLRQLIAHIGDEAFVAGIRSYLREHAYGNADLGGFLRAMESGAGVDLASWSDAWLRTAGLDTISAELARDGTGAMLTVRREPPAQYPADRPHTLDVGGWTDGRAVLHSDLTVSGDQVAVSVREDEGVALLLPNAGDLTWARVRLDGETVRRLPAQLPLVPDPGPRAVVWAALVDALALAELHPDDFLAVLAAAWPHEDEASILSWVGRFTVGRLLPEYRPGPEARAVVARAALERLRSAAAASSPALAAARLLARTTDDTDLLLRWLAGTELPAGLEDDADFRWTVVRSLAVLDAIDPGDIDRVRRQDSSLPGRLAALTALAARPGAEAKSWAWGQLVGRTDRSNYEMNALADGFWASGELEVLRPYVQRFHEEVPALADRVGQDALARMASLAYPRTVVEPATDAATSARLAQGDLTPAVRRVLVDQQSVLREVLLSRQRFTGRPGLLAVADPG